MGNVVYPSFRERKREFERIFEWRWALRVLPGVLGRMEGCWGAIERGRVERERRAQMVVRVGAVKAEETGGPLGDEAAREAGESDEEGKPKVDIMDIREGLRRLHLQRQLEESMSMSET